ncbi:IS1595 family transposase [Kineosporia sp. R_H_3]|uniref:IS1595 family transposase n=1 Tax=Kineosporia sp. R_H_3 TaxID=1961848 RepID=UPI00117A94B6|nr:IS1595 family transposase [Kineosporia sp. R_H_3]
MVAEPVAGVDYPSTAAQLRRWFPDDEACIEYLARLRWPDGFVCPACSGNGFWRTGPGLWMCATCSRKTSVTAGTLFHRSRTPLSTWFEAIWFVTSSKDGLSAAALQEHLGLVSYETAWAWLRTMRSAMADPEQERLGGGEVQQVEIGEAFLGGVTRDLPGATTLEVPVMIAVERLGPRRLGRLRLETTRYPGSLEALHFAARAVRPEALVATDGAPRFRRLALMGFGHTCVEGYEDPGRGRLLPGPRQVATLLDRWFVGTMRYGVRERHLASYLDEFMFRFDHRTAASRGLPFYRFMVRAANGGPRRREPARPGVR